MGEETNVHADGFPADKQSELAERYGWIFRLFVAHRDYDAVRAAVEGTLRAGTGSGPHPLDRAKGGPRRLALGAPT